MKNTKQIILASSSPRRRQLLTQVGLKFKVAKSNYEEDMSQKMKPAQMVKTFSLGKARDVAQRYKNAIIVGSDTIVVYNNKKLGKPKSPAEAKKMLKMLSNKAHTVLTGITVINSKTGKTITDYEATKVYIKKIWNKSVVNILYFFGISFFLK